MPCRHTTSSYFLWLVVTVLLVTGCGDDDGAEVSTVDAGEPCRSGVDGVGNCWCNTGTVGLRYCQPSGVWNACACNEPPPPVTCNDGDLVACTCPDLTQSVQRCRAANTREPCMCADVGTDAGTLDSGNEDAG